MKQELIIKQGEIAAYNPFRAQLQELKETNEKTIFDYEDSKGNKEARSHVYTLRQTKAAVDRVRKDEKQEALEYGRKVDSEAKEIISEIEQMIERHQKPLDAIEQREKDRIEKIELDLAEIEEVGNYTTSDWADMPLGSIKDRLAEIEAKPITEDQWAEYIRRAAQIKDTAVTQIRAAIAKREKYDAEQAELIRLRLAEEAQKQKEREDQIARVAAELARKQAQDEQKRKDEESSRKARAEREAGERREIELKLQAEQAERARVEAERRAEHAQQEAEQKAKREAEENARKEKEEAERREANKRHRTKVNNDALKAMTGNGISEKVGKRVIDLIATKAIPHISITY